MEPVPGGLRQAAGRRRWRRALHRRLDVPGGTRAEGRGVELRGVRVAPIHSQVADGAGVFAVEQTTADPRFRGRSAPGSADGRFWGESLSVPANGDAGCLRGNGSEWIVDLVPCRFFGGSRLWAGNLEPGNRRCPGAGVDGCCRRVGAGIFGGASRHCSHRERDRGGHVLIVLGKGIGGQGGRCRPV